MWLIRAALRRPITILVAVIAVALTAVFAVSRMRADIFPDLDLPVIYVAQPYGGMSPAQMEGYITYYYEYHFLYVNGIESVESKSIQNTSLLKLTFHPGTDMAEALAQTIGYVNRARAFMPPGTVGPFIMRFDAGTVPVGYLVFASESRSLGEIQDLALNRVRPQFATLPGLTSPPPFGGSQRTIVIRVDPDRLRSYGMSPDEVIRAVSAGNVIMPSGSVNIGEETRISPMNSVVANIDDLLELPIRTGAGPPVSIRDIGTVSDSTDIPTAYALVNGRRAVYIPVTKRPDASTLSVVSEVKANLGRFQALVPDDITVSYELDQSRNVAASLQAVLREAALGALLTGLMVLLFLRDWRSAGIVVVTIPFALLAAVIALWGAGQTINVMTLGGLALAVGILVDEATVAIENIHTHLARGVAVARGVLEASGEVVVPRMLAMLSVVAVFVPSFFMTGVSRSLFVPLSLAVGFSMIASFFLSSSLVPVLSVWLLGRRRAPRAGTSHADDWVDRLRHRLGQFLHRVAPARWSIVTVYAGGDHRRRHRRRSHARPRDLSRRGRQPVPVAIPGARGDEVRIDRAAGDRGARRDQTGRRSEQRGDHAGLCRRPTVLVPDQHDFPLDRRIARRRAAGGAQAGGGHSAHGLRGNAARAVQRTISHRAVLVRAWRHRQSDHELRHVDPGRGRRDGTGFRGQPDVCGEGPGRARAHSGASRSAVRPGARLSGDPGRREPPDGRPTRRHRRSGRAILCRRDVVQPVRRAELLGRPADRHRVPGAGRGPAAADDHASTICAWSR